MHAAATHGLAPLCASSTAVGVAGYTLAGGMGPLARRHGFAADHVRRLRLVTADGRPHEIDADRTPELFWALRGGGASGFGVVTELEFALFPVVRLHGGGLFLPDDAAADVLHAWREWAPTLPEDTGTSVALLRLPRDPALPAVLRGRAVVHLRFTHVGPAAEAQALLAPMRRVAPVVLDDGVAAGGGRRAVVARRRAAHLRRDGVDRGAAAGRRPRAAARAAAGGRPRRHVRRGAVTRRGYNIRVACGTSPARRRGTTRTLAPV